MVPSAPKTKPKKKAKAKPRKKSKDPKKVLSHSADNKELEGVEYHEVQVNPNRKKAVSLWTSGEDRELFDRARKRFGDSLSELVRVLVSAYDRGHVVLTDGTVKVVPPSRAS